MMYGHVCLYRSLLSFRFFGSPSSLLCHGSSQFTNLILLVVVIRRPSNILLKKIVVMCPINLILFFIIILLSILLFLLELFHSIYVSPVVGLDHPSPQSHYSHCFKSLSLSLSLFASSFTCHIQ